MLDDISKILKSVKKGVVIVENGEPAYVLVPFKDYKENALPPGNRREMDSSESGTAGEQAMDDPALIQKMIDYEVELSASGASTLEDINALLDRSKDQEEKEAKEINLEDLPF